MEPVGLVMVKRRRGDLEWMIGRCVRLFVFASAFSIFFQQAEERSRKRLKLLLPQEKRSPPPPTLPHLSRSPSPPFVAPYPQPVYQHLSYSSFVMDKAVTHTFRSGLLDELEDATNGLIEGEATMKRALGRLWHAMSQDPEKPKTLLGSQSGPTQEPRDNLESRPSEIDPAISPPKSAQPNSSSQTIQGSLRQAMDHDTETSRDVMIPKREDDEEANGQEKRIARAPDLTPSIHKHFLFSCSNNPAYSEQSHFTSPNQQRINLERAMTILRELQDDGREYIERLEEIREGLGDIRAHRDGIWDMVRERAVRELKETALAYAEGNTE